MILTYKTALYNTYSAVRLLYYAYKNNIDNIYVLTLKSVKTINIIEKYSLILLASKGA
jgi:hypothetical protein